ncbi:antigen [Sarotherodon galilaeus]
MGCEGGSGKTITKKFNMVAALSDGVTVVKVTLFEAFVSKVQEGHELRGTAPPYAIHISAATQFFKASALCVPEELLSKADNLLHPPAPLTQFKMSSTNVGLITVEGEVVECLAIRKVVSGNQEVPIKNLQLKQDACTMRLCLWREAAVHELHVGDHIKVSHVKVTQSTFGFKLHTTVFTKVETNEEARAEVNVVAVTSTNSPNQLELLLEDGESLFIEAHMWQPFEKDLEKAMVCVNMKLKGKHVSEIGEEKKKQKKTRV